MGQYKVIQDIEAEDKLLGPLSLRQFIYAIIVVVSAFIGFKLITATGGKWYLAIPLIPHTIFFAVLAAPFGHDQSNEIWLLAKIRFFLKPRNRIWDQTGIKELVTITVPKKIERQLTKGFSQEEVQSRLMALANTIDSRGWAVKNVNVNMFQQPAYAGMSDSDRLVAPSEIPREVPIEDVGSSYDILDELDNPRARSMDRLINSSEQSHHQQIVGMMQSQMQVNPAADQNTNSSQWFTQTPAAGQTVTAPVQPAPTVQTLNPIPQQPTQLTQNQPIPQPLTATPQNVNPYPHVPPVTPVTDPAIIKLAINDDLNVATIARQADKVAEQHNDEVVISLR